MSDRSSDNDENQPVIKRMREPDVPLNEVQRLQALHTLALLDTPAAEGFDRITRLASAMFDVPIALVSLVDKQRQWFKSKQGLDASETPRNISFCGHAINSPEILYISDTLNDPRFADNPLVLGEPHIRMYAGAPLTTSQGFRVGTLCIIDYKPRCFSVDELSRLRDLADCVQNEFQRSSIQDAAQTIRDHESRLRAVLNTVADGIVVINDQGVIKTVNPALERLFAYPMEEVIGCNVKMLLPDSYAAQLERYIRHYIATGESDILDSREVLGRRKDGSTFPMELALSEMSIGGAHMFTAIVRDITERKHAELDTQRYANALEELQSITASTGLGFEQKIHALLELGREVFNLPIGIISYIKKDRFVIEFSVGSDQSAVPGTEFSLAQTYCHLTLAAQKPTGIHHAGKSDINTHACYKKFGFESYLGTPLLVGRQLYGTLYFAGANIHDGPFSVSDYSLIRLFAQWVGNEIARLRAQAVLNEKAERIRSIVDTVVDGIITINRYGIVESYNPAAKRIFGFEPEDVIGENVHMLMPTPYSEEHDEYLQRYLEGGVAKVIGIGREVEGRRKDGSTFPMELAVSEMDIHGERMFTGIVRDITERKKVERMKTEFVSMVSHELRTPLTSIRGAIGLVLGNATGELAEKTRELLEMANRNSERLVLLINDILDMEKIESGKLTFDFKIVDVLDLVKSALDANQGYASSHNIRLKLVSNQTGPLNVRGDEHRLLQVFANLISNAVKYSPENGRVDIDVYRNGEVIRASVRDYGCGITEEFRSRMFQRFSQADSSDSREKGGTGLGLAITKKIIEQHEGCIDYISNPGDGTEIYFEIPTWTGDVGIVKERARTRKPLKSKVWLEGRVAQPRVLVCEDNADVAYMISCLLEEHGLIADIATSAENTLALLEKNQYSLLLADLNLPGMDGLQLLRELRENPETRQLPVIVISVRADESRRNITGNALEVVDWLQKPIDKARLTTALGQALNGTTHRNVLHVEDDMDIVQIVKLHLDDITNFHYVTTIEAARQCLQDTKFDIVILDLTLPDGSGLELLQELLDQCPVVIFSGQEVSAEVNELVTAALTKSADGGEQLASIIERIFNDGPEPE